MTITELLSYYGSQRKAAHVLGITQCRVSLWKGVIPIERQCQYEVLTKGKLKADRDKLAKLKKDEK